MGIGGTKAFRITKINNMKNTISSTSIQIKRLTQTLKGVTETSRRIRIKQALRHLRILQAGSTK